MYFSIEQIEASLSRLTDVNPFFGISFLAFKRFDLLVGSVQGMVFSNVIDDFLEEFHRVTDRFDGFFQPYSATKHWVNARYGSTSLQRTTVDAFGDVLIHTKNSSEWGWRKDYVTRLQKHLKGARLPAFDLAVWLYRLKKWPQGTSPQKIIATFIEEFRITAEETRSLFDADEPSVLSHWIVEHRVTEGILLDALGPPPGQLPAEGAALKFLDLVDVGPGSHFHYEPAERLNIITGDNSLGKTFLLETIWWSLTQDWLEIPVQPKPTAAKTKPRITFSVSTRGRVRESTALYDWERLRWTFKRKSPPSPPALVIYARYDGSFAIADPARRFAAEDDDRRYLYFRRNDVWDGLKLPGKRGMETLCNGLVSDWVLWQTGGERYGPQFEALESAIAALSPSAEEGLRLGEPRRLGLDSREIPTLSMPYGDVPLLFASAGVQRVSALAYVLVWAWNEHMTFSSVIRRQPQRRLVLIIDEVEAHLHPRWQRVIIPSLMKVIEELATELAPQIHIATHSPMVMASAEPVFDEVRDNLHHLKLVDDDVILEELPFVKFGRADAWLTSDVFGLAQARSLPGEQAIELAKALQLEKQPNQKAVGEVDELLSKNLADDDIYWPRWRFFAEKHGVAR
ncbi:MAG TPA: AAA family ATPase [Tepidisphaeraceae bacterium]|jgi:hypothetical protein|nr:AAA family ATPase [Tepidisphaeraceae bacterium]